MERRNFLTISAATIGGVIVYTLDRRLSRVSAEDKAVRIPLHFFDESEALVVAAAVARIFPSDETGPGAQEAGVVVYIDRQLAGSYGRDSDRYLQGPFESGVPEVGYQGKATRREIYREGVKNLRAFDQLTPAEQDAALKRVESTEFFVLLRQHAIEGMFSDPMHGGNIDMVGWQLIGFPGPQMTYVEDVDKHFGQAFRPKPVSLIGGHPLEDEK
jgi:gluconate 2-dehydrogenase gamma chain